MTADTDAAGHRGYDGSNVFLAGVPPQQFVATLASPVDLDEFEDAPDSLAADDQAHIAPVPTGNRSEQMFERMAPGDLVLCYVEGDYLGVGRVGGTFDDTGFARALWNADVAGGYVLEDFVELDLPARVVNSLFDYAPDYTPGGLIRVADGRVGHSLAAIRVAVERFSEQRA